MDRDRQTYYVHNHIDRNRQKQTYGCGKKDTDRVRKINKERER